MVRVVVPYIDARVYRPFLEASSIKSAQFITDQQKRNNVEPLPIWFKEIYRIQKPELKGFEHEETALFGNVLEFSIGAQPSSELFRKVLPNYHVEVHYENMGYDDATKAHGSLFDQQDEFDLFEKTNTENILEPRFQGAVWKAHLIQKPNQSTSKINAWGYLRMLQYVNVPRSKPNRLRSRNTIKVMGVNEIGKPKTYSTKEMTYRNDFLDYVDNIFTKSFTHVGRGTIFAPVNIEEDEIIFDGKALRNNGFQVTLTKDTGARAGDLAFDMAESWVEYNLSINSRLTSLSKLQAVNNAPRGGTRNRVSQSKILEDIDNLKASGWGIIRFLDTTINFSGLASELRSFRLIGEVVVMDQLYLTNLLVAGIVVDQGLNTWYTPILNFSSEYTANLRNINQGSLSKLIYLRFKITPSYTADNTEPMDEKSMSTIAVFNFDTFNIMQNFDTLVDASLYQLNNFSDEEDSSNFDSLSAIQKLSIALSTLSLPQSEAETNIFLNNYISPESTDDIQQIDQRLVARKVLMQNLGLNIQWLGKFLRKDDGIINYIKNIPASYMRQDVYQGSQFKVATTDSLSLPRVIQIITSTMKGYPATNNPKTAEVEGNVNNYAIFLANRVIIKPKVLYSFTKKETQETQKYEYVSNLRDKVKEKKKTYMFLVLDVGFEEQVSTEEDIDYEIDVGNVNELEMIKGTSINHMFNFRFSDSLGEFDPTYFSETTSDSITSDSTQQLASEEHLFDPKIFMWIKDEEDYGFSPSEFQTLSITDMVQNFNYDSVKNRVAINGFSPKNASDLVGDYPIHHPLVAATALITSVTRPITIYDFAFNIIAEYNNTRTIHKAWDDAESNSTIVYSKKTLADSNLTNLKYVINQQKLISVTKYCDFQDLLDELIYLKKLKDDPNLQYKHIANAAEPLFDNIQISIPFNLDIDSNKNMKVAKGAFHGTLSEFIDSYYEEFSLGSPTNKFNSKDMAWNTPISGHKAVVVSQVDSNDSSITDSDSIRSITFEEINIVDNPSNVNERISNNLLAVYALDLIVKGIRYILWSIAKSRFTAVAYLPMEHVSDRKNKNEKLYEKQYGINFHPIRAGSSVRFKMSEDNTYLKSESGFESREQNDDQFDRFDPHKARNTSFEPHPFVYIDRSNIHRRRTKELIGATTTIIPADALFREATVTNTVLPRSIAESQANRELNDTVLTWYVSKRISYIGVDGGAMVRLLMTEGSFDWTIFWREDTIATRISENYLLTGMGNFFLRGAGGD